jgi:D-3-phosphoglycerate dehydrogenase / 2-oxoglutarate reductase
MEDVVGCDAILARTASFPREVIEAESKLKIIARHGVGYNNIDIKAAEENGVYVTNTPDANADTVAEHTIGLLIAIAKNLVKVDKALREGNFNIRDKVRGSDIAGKTLSIIGLGRIGKIVAQKAMYGLDMNVIAYDPFIHKDEIDQKIRLCNWEEVFCKADFISLHLPATESTKKIISKKGI